MCYQYGGEGHRHPGGIGSRTSPLASLTQLAALMTILNIRLDTLLAIVRLGDADRLGWWRSHSVDETAEYVLGHAFPSTWMASGLELAMESARIRHERSLRRATAVHLWSDYLPFHQLLTSWLIERKLERDTEQLGWLRAAGVDDLQARLGPSTENERRGEGLYLGDVTKGELVDDELLAGIFYRLVGGYVSLGSEFAAPYLDLVA
jgi:hypothetical protein